MLLKYYWKARHTLYRQRANRSSSSAACVFTREEYAKSNHYLSIQKHEAYEAYLSACKAYLQLCKITLTIALK